MTTTSLGFSSISMGTYVGLNGRLTGPREFGPETSLTQMFRSVVAGPAERLLVAIGLKINGFSQNFGRGFGGAQISGR